VFQRVVTGKDEAELLKMRSGVVHLSVRRELGTISHSVDGATRVAVTLDLKMLGFRCVDGALMLPEISIVIPRGPEGTRGSTSVERATLLRGPDKSLIYREESDIEQNGFFFRPKAKLRLEIMFKHTAE
jgi:hypothetical protein